MTDSDALLSIQDLMDGVEWTPDTLNEIAKIMQKAGYNIRDIDEPEYVNTIDALFPIPKSDE